jgi:hypothetical protein
VCHGRGANERAFFDIRHRQLHDGQRSKIIGQADGDILTVLGANDEFGPVMAHNRVAHPYRSAIRGLGRRLAQSAGEARQNRAPDVRECAKAQSLTWSHVAWNDSRAGGLDSTALGGVERKEHPTGTRPSIGSSNKRPQPPRLGPFP